MRRLPARCQQHDVHAVDPNDRDHDGVTNTTDNCPDVANPTRPTATTTVRATRAIRARRREPRQCRLPVDDLQDQDGHGPERHHRAHENALVTGKGSNGFFVQTKAGDAGYMGSDYSGLFVYTGTMSPRSRAPSSARASRSMATSPRSKARLELDSVTAVTPRPRRRRGSAGADQRYLRRGQDRRHAGDYSSRACSSRSAAAPSRAVEHDVRRVHAHRRRRLAVRRRLPVRDATLPTVGSAYTAVPASSRYASMAIASSSRAAARDLVLGRPVARDVRTGAELRARRARPQRRHFPGGQRAHGHALGSRARRHRRHDHARAIPLRSRSPAATSPCRTA